MSTEKSILFSERLRSLRKNLKKAEFARVLGISSQVYQRYEEGRVPRADMLSVIAEKTGATVDWLLGREPGIVYPELSQSDERRLVAEHRSQTDHALRSLIDDIDQLARLLILAPDDAVAAFLRRQLDARLDKFQTWCSANRPNAVDAVRYDARQAAQQEKGSEGKES